MITIDEMRPSLLTLDEVRERLQPTENLSQFEFSTDGQDHVKFEFPDNWNKDLELLGDTDTTAATVDVNGTVRPLTKQAILQATTSAHMNSKFVENVPAELLGINMDYWYTHGNKRQKLLASPDAAVAFTRDTVTPFSNIELLDRVVQALETKFNTDDILVDFKFHHDLKQTIIRLIVPSQYREIGSARASSSEDPWSVGVELRNSIIGASSTELNGYLFAWWCTNGATSTYASSGKYRRKPTANPEDAYEWAASVVDDVLGGLEGELDGVQELTSIPLEGELNETLGSMFDRFNVPVRTREAVIINLADSDDLSAYGLMNAITQAANNPDLTYGAISSLLEAGGKLSHVLGDRCDVCHRF